MNRLKKGTALVVLLALALQMRPVAVSASEIQYRVNVQVFVDGEEIGWIPALDENYENNMYISLKGLAAALEGTKKAFSPSVEKQRISIESGAGAVPELSAWSEDALKSSSKANIAKNELFVDGIERKYYSIIVLRGDNYDAFLPPVSLAMMFDLDMEVSEDRIEIHTDAPFQVSAKEMEESGYLQGVNALVIGDGTTGDIFYRYEGDEVFPIASTTKLMTYLVFMDTVTQGECSLDDIVIISGKASRLSNSPDGVIPMLAGSRVPVKDLLYGMLLPSSNECALALAEHAAGSQEAFVERMNERAQELGWTNAEFYNCHGLPNYEDQLVPAKMHNHMTAEEMFQLVSVILDIYPQITEITSAQTYYMASFDIDLKNTNAVLYNMDNAVGFKTGTTNRAGACLVTGVTAMKEGEQHDLIAVMFGADGDANRGIVSELSARYAVQALKGDADTSEEAAGGAEGGIVIPKDPELVIRRLIKNKR